MEPNSKNPPAPTETRPPQDAATQIFQRTMGHLKLHPHFEQCPTFGKSEKYQQCDCCVCINCKGRCTKWRDEEIGELSDIIARAAALVEPREADEPYQEHAHEFVGSQHPKSHPLACDSCGCYENHPNHDSHRKLAAPEREPQVQSEFDVLLNLALARSERELYDLLLNARNITELAAATNLPANTVSVYIGRLVEKGLVQQLFRGTYLRKFIPFAEREPAPRPQQSRSWTKQDYDHSAAISTVADHIVKRVAENAVRLAIARHDLANDAETPADEIVKDILGVVMGEDASCDPDDDESVEILWAEKELRETLKEYPATAAASSPVARPQAAYRTDERIDEDGLQAFTEAMRKKLAAKRAEGYCGWNDDCTVEHLAELLLKHVPKGDPIDIANFCMMLWNRDGQDALKKLAEPAARIEQPTLKKLRQELYDQTNLSEEAIFEVSLWILKRGRQ